MASPFPPAAASLALAMLAALTACKDRRPAPPATGASSSSSSSSSRPPPSPPPATVAITLRLDGHDVTTLTQLAARTSLATRLPADARDLATWQHLSARTDDGRRLDVPDVATRYPGHDVALYLDGGRPTLGLFPPVRADQPPHVQRALAAPALSLVGVTSIDVDRDAAPAGPPVAAPAPLEVVVGGRTVTLDPARLDALPALPGGHKQGGWHLRDVLAAAGAGHVTALTAVGREGASPIDPAQLDQPGVRATIRRNRRGELRLGIERDDGDAGEPIVVHALQRLETRP